MKVRQLIRWIKDNNVDENIDSIINNNPQTRKTIKLIENYIDKEFRKFIDEQNIINEQMILYRKVITPDIDIRTVEDTKQLMVIRNNIGDLNMLATFIEKHTTD